MSDGKPLYKVKLNSGRVLGPLDLARIRQLIAKNQIIGTETAREYPKGEWKDINRISEVAALILERAGGADKSNKYEPLLGTQGQGSTHILPESAKPLPGATNAASIPSMDTPKEESHSPADDHDRTLIEKFDPAVETALHDGKTTVGTSVIVDERSKKITEHPENLDLEPVDPSFTLPRRISEERTVVFQRTDDNANLPGKRKLNPKEILRAALAGLAVAAILYEFLGGPDQTAQKRWQPVRPTLPSYAEKPDPEASGKIYAEAMRYYVQDTVSGYKLSASRLRQAAALDSSNVKALAMLASSYLNLIDSSNKDENYFSVISKLIEQSRAKALDLPETVIADVEFFVMANKAEAAQNRIVEYTKTHQNFGIEMFYYLALAFYQRGDTQSAARFISQFPENKIYSAKVYYLRGLIAEKLNDPDGALREYRRAIKFNSEHAKSYLRVADLLSQQGRLKDAKPELKFMMDHGGLDLLAPKDMALGYFLDSKLNEMESSIEVALGDIERAVRLDKDNHDYLLQLYTLRAKAGESIQSVQKKARMYYFLSEGEKMLRAARYQDALAQFLMARQTNESSPIPLVKIGDMFSRLHDLSNAKANYKMAADRAPNDIEVWSKYIHVLIQAYDWEEASKAMERFRQLPVSQSSIDKAAADMYEKQGLHPQAQVFYKKAMARETIDPDVYIAYAKSLMATKNFKEAPFFFALALRFDPLNADAIIGTAKCVAATESIDRAVELLQDELQKGSGLNAELLAAIAEFHIQKGDWDLAQKEVEQAIAANPDYGYPWKLQGQIYLNKEGSMRGALEKALFAFQSFSDRTPSDPSGYLERYSIFIKKTEFEKAAGELDKIYAVYPKYPNLHYYRGRLFGVQGNHLKAIEEYAAELKNNPGSVPSLIEKGRELVLTSKFADALTQFSQAMQLAPQSAEAKYQAGYANYLLKNYPAAIALFQAALQLDQGNPLLYKRLGMAYRDSGDHVQAQQAFRKYLEMEPDAPDKNEVLGYR